MEATVLFAGQRAIERRLLEDDADASANLRLVVREIGAGDLDAARGCGERGGEDADRGCLPRAVRSKEGEERTLRNVK